MPRALQRSTWNASVSRRGHAASSRNVPSAFSAPAVPVRLALDEDRWERRRQRAGGHDVLRPDALRRRIEVADVPGGDFGRADAKAHVVGVDAVEVDKPLQRRLERCGVVEARRAGAAGLLRERRQRTRHEESALALHERAGRRQRAHPRAQHTVRRQPRERVAQRGRRWPRGRRCGLADRVPEIAQALDAPLRRVAGEDGRGNGTDRRPGEPDRPEAGGVQSLVDAALVRTERAAALQHERNRLVALRGFRRRRDSPFRLSRGRGPRGAHAHRPARGGAHTRGCHCMNQPWLTTML